MSNEPRDLSRLPDSEVDRQLRDLQAEHTRRLNEQMEQAQKEINALLAKYPQLKEGSILRVALGRRQAQKARERYLGQQINVGDIQVTGHIHLGRGLPSERELDKGGGREDQVIK